jgi:hypothetical protein
MIFINVKDSIWLMMNFTRTLRSINNNLHDSNIIHRNNNNNNNKYLYNNTLDGMIFINVKDSIWLFDDELYKNITFHQ